MMKNKVVLEVELTFSGDVSGKANQTEILMNVLKGLHDAADSSGLAPENSEEVTVFISVINHETKQKLSCDMYKSDWV